MSKEEKIIQAAIEVFREKGIEKQRFQISLKLLGSLKEHFIFISHHAFLLCLLLQKYGRKNYRYLR